MRFVCLFLAGAGMLGAQVVEGSVSNSVTRLGVSDVQVRLQRVRSIPGIGVPTETEQVSEAQQEPYEALTEVSGKFRIEGVKDGKYNVTWFREGYFALRSVTAPVEVKAGDPLELDLKMTPLGRVTGRVLDGKDHPVSGAKLELSSGTGGAQTRIADDDGQFAIDNVGSGTFTLMAYAPEEWDPPEPVDGKKQAWAATYYPGIIHADSAGRIFIAPGGEVTGLEIKLLAVLVRRVSGVVLGPDGKPVQAAEVRLTRSQGRQANLQSTTTDKDGKFELAVVDGTYRVSGQMTDEEATLHTETEVLVSGKDVSEVELRLKAPFKIHGKLSYDPPRPPDTKTRTSIFLTEGAGPGVISMSNATVEGDTFTLPAIYAGTYTLLASEPEPPYYLASVRVSGQDGMAGPVYLGSGNDPAEIVFRAGGGAVSGNVEDCHGGAVELIPVQENLRGMVPKFDRCDAVGHFTVQAVRPGDYYALAVAPLQGAPVALVTLLRQATKVTVREGETTRVDLKAVKVGGQ